MSGRDGKKVHVIQGGQGGLGRGRGKYVKKRMHDYKYKELKFVLHGSGQDKQSVTFGKVHDMII